MSAAKISRYPVPDLKDLPADIRETILAVQEKAGFVPNVFLVLAHRPDEFRAFFAYHDALLERDSGLSKAEMSAELKAINPNQPAYFAPWKAACLADMQPIHRLFNSFRQ